MIQLLKSSLWYLSYYIYKGYLTCKNISSLVPFSVTFFNHTHNKNSPLAYLFTYTLADTGGLGWTKGGLRMSCFAQAISHRWHSLSASSIVICWSWLLEFSFGRPLDTDTAVMSEHYVRCYHDTCLKK